MAEKNSNIDKLFNDHLVGYRAKAPADAWERLHAELHKGSSARTIWLWRSVAAAMLLLVAFSAGYFFSDFQKSNAEQFTLNEQTEVALPEQNVISPENSDAEISVSREVSINGKQENNLIPKAEPPGEPLIPGEMAVVSEETKLIAPVKITDQPAGELAAIAPKQQEEDQPNENLKPIPVDIIAEDEFAEETTEPENLLFDDPEFLRQLLIADESLAFDFSGQTEKSSSSNWSVGGRISPLYSYRSISDGSYETANEAIAKEYFDEVESGLLTIAGGISLNYKFSDRWSLGSGMYVSRIGQETSQVLALATPGGSGMYKLATSAGTVTINPAKFQSVMVEQQVSVKDTIPGGYLVSGDFVQNLDYFEVPFIMQYKITDKRFSVQLMGGLSPGILVNNRSYFESDGHKVQTGIVEDVNPMIYNSVVGFGLEYSISEKVSLNLEPTFKYSLSPVNTSSNLSTHPYSMSWFTGITYKFY